ncbi:S-(hydroxymethyl)glutathione dehydrogenase/alcohol dehydrogenase [Rhodococcus wratislaviensis]|uniref:Zinc-containing alcohol dehydrogenase n=1 Tax=Rhodococcus wratislaviensis TaxID=44752 RepID=A0AB38FGF2_RHOWR|nr:zinc-binding dehydrogenase [Rhodococcus wratislaviensis]REE74195.1 S-(hydroxymethyl)glutathione dehydrogenase/alcohol dehydrogenase [Rhodococcus wratislaviensis]SPZ40267.1 putative zinc-containing alcohol dehydrogenase [Rhodococcus wratislaviensis]
MQAAVLHRTGDEQLDVTRSITATSFGPGRVRVRLHKAGLCHSDLSAMSGVLPHKAPFVPGHEGAGEVVEVGDGVADLAVGDRVVICWMPPCDRCPSCTSGAAHLCLSGYKNLATPNFEMDGIALPGMMGEGTFAEEVVVSAAAAITIPDDVPYEIAALIGCGVTTGIGAALNTARVEPGSSVVVIGLGGVGISILQGARVAGAAQIVAVDPTSNRRDWALKFGATTAVSPEELQDTVKRLSGGAGVDYAFEAVGTPGTLRAAYDCTRRGGTVCLVGAGSRTEPLGLTMGELVLDEKKLLPSFFGGDDVRRTYAKVVELWRAGRIDLQSMITHHVPLSGINEAIRQMRTGEALRTVIDIL